MNGPSRPRRARCRTVREWLAAAHNHCDATILGRVDLTWAHDGGRRLSGAGTVAYLPDDRTWQRNARAREVVSATAGCPADGATTPPAAQRSSQHKARSALNREAAQPDCPLHALLRRHPRPPNILDRLRTALLDENRGWKPFACPPSNTSTWSENRPLVLEKEPAFNCRWTLAPSSADALRR